MQNGPSPGRGEVLVRTLATGDLGSALEMGLLPVVSTTSSSTVGRRWGELGTYPVYLRAIISVADRDRAFVPGRDGLSVGDRVLSHLAAHAEYDVIAADGTVLVPDGIDDDTATLAQALGSTALHGVTRSRQYSPATSWRSWARASRRPDGRSSMSPDRWRHDDDQRVVARTAFRYWTWRRALAQRTLGQSVKLEDAVESRSMRYSDGGPDVVIEIAGAPAAVPLALSLARD